MIRCTHVLVFVFASDAYLRGRIAVNRVEYDLPSRASFSFRTKNRLGLDRGFFSAGPLILLQLQIQQVDDPMFDGVESKEIPCI